MSNIVHSTEVNLIWFVVCNSGTPIGHNINMTICILDHVKKDYKMIDCVNVHCDHFGVPQCGTPKGLDCTFTIAYFLTLSWCVLLLYRCIFSYYHRLRFKSSLCLLRFIESHM